MKCENKLCVYQLNGKCVLDKISIDSLGMCTECIYPEIDEKVLNQAKSKLLRAYKREDNI